MSRSFSFGLGAKNLKDRDFFGVSDPYVIISRPCSTGGFVKMRTSETKMNTLNPEWNDFMITEAELAENGYFDKELKLMFRVYDDDGKKGPDAKDQLIGVGHFSLQDLEAANRVKTSLPLSDQKNKKAAGYLVVRSFREHGGPSMGSSGGSFQQGGQFQQQQQAGYGGQPHGASGYPSGGQTPYPAQPGYNAGGGQGYPGVTAGGGQGYPSVAAYQGYPGAPCQGQGYAGGPPQYGAPPPGQVHGGYHGVPGAGYPPPSGAPGAGFPPSSGAPQYPPAANNGAFPDTNMFPPSNLPPGPGAGGWRN